MTELFDPVRGTSEPDRVWTLTNAAEATPDILSPLCWSVWEDPLEVGWRGAMLAFGVISAKEVVSSPNPNDHATSVIYGRQVFNIDALRPVIARLPGISLDDFERDILGTVRPGLPRPSSARHRLPLVMVKLPYAMLTAGRKLHRMHDDFQQWWRHEVHDVSRGARPPARGALEQLVDARERFGRIFVVHAIVRFQLQAIQGAVTTIAQKVGRPELGTAALSGQGGVAETKLADDAWRLAHGELTEDEFLLEYGFHGPNEGNVYTRSWREQPDRLRHIAKAFLGREDAARPRDRERDAGVAGRRAAEELTALASRADRTQLTFMLARAHNVIPNLETGKATYLMTLDGARFAARRLGVELVDAGRLDEVDDAFFLTIPELTAVVGGDLPEARDLVAFRREAREEYATMIIPTNFVGMPDPDVAAPGADGPVELSGVASGGGVVEGRARVVTDPNSDVELDDGDILVCRFTDPSWAPLFTFAQALVIDIGGAASHGAVVAREMGLPYVIGTENGSRVIPDGARIEVDGTANRVRVLD